MWYIRQALVAVALLSAPAVATAEVAVAPAPTTNASVSIAAGNTFQTVLAAVAAYPAAPRRSITIENNNTSDNCWVYVGSGVATKGTAILLQPGGSYTRYSPFIPSDAIQATCAITSDTLYVDSQ
jgi:hypothetical protein